MPYHLIKSLENSDPHCTFTSPFQFILPDSVANASAILPSSCHRLPPSFDVNNAYSKGWTPYQPPTASITYLLHCVVGLETTGGEEVVEAYEEIKFLPYGELQPPLFMPSFPGEFALDCEKPVRKGILGRQLGRLRVMTEEPNPIVYTSASTTPSTHCTARIAFSGPSLSIPHARKLTLRVKLALRSKTFYSIKDIQCIPNQSLVTSNGYLRLHDDITKVSESKFSELEWTRLPRPEDQREEKYQNKTNCDLLSGLESPHSSALILRQGFAVDHGDSIETWSTSISVPITPEQMLQPTFCTKLISRS